MKRALLIGALMMASPAMAQKVPLASGQYYGAGIHIDDMSPGQYLQSPGFIITSPVHTTELIHAAPPHGKDCIITVGGASEIDVGGGCSISGNTLKPNDPTGDLIIRKAN